MKKRSARLILIGTVWLFTCLSCLGCAIAKYGQAEVTPFDISVPSGLVGQDKTDIMRSLGDPDVVVNEGATEYWGYHNLGGWYFSFYVAFGMNSAQDLVVAFSGEKATNAFLVDKGSAIGIMMAPMAVAN